MNYKKQWGYHPLVVTLLESERKTKHIYMSALEAFLQQRATLERC